MAMDDNAGPDDAIRSKLRLLKTGIYGFIGSLVFAVFSLFSMGAASLLGLLWPEGGIIETIGNAALDVIPLFFALPVAFFILIMTALLKKPRDADMAPHMKPAMGGLVIIIAGGVALCALPVLVSFIIVMTALYYRGSGIIFLALAYFGLSCLVFFLSVAYTLVREVAASREAQTGFAWVRRAFRVLRVGSPDAGPEMDAASHRTLTRIERAVGSAMGTVLFLLFKGKDLYDTVRSITGHGSDSGWLDVLVSKEMTLALFAMFVFIFSTLFIIRSVKTVFIVKSSESVEK